MKRFLFPFEALARLRRRRREACELALAEARGRQARLAGQRRLLEAEHDDARLLWRSALPAKGPLDPAAAAGHRAYADLLERRLKLAGRAVSRAAQEAEARRLELLEAARHEKVVQRLRERRHAVWAVGSAREEQAFLDEAALAGRRGP